MDFNKSRSTALRWTSMLVVLMAQPWFLNTAQTSFADEPRITPSVDSTVAPLIEQLGNANFATREDANRKLLAIGAAALPALRSAENHTSVEVRERARRIRAEIDKAVFEQVTKRFILEADSQQSFGLPGWKIFRQISGDSRTSKLLFVAMLRNQRDLAQSVDLAEKAKGTASATKALSQLESRMVVESERLRTRNFRGQPAEVGDTVGLLLAASMFSDTISIEVNESIATALFLGTQAEYFSKAGYGRCMRALAGRWIPKTQPALADNILNLAMQHAIPEGAVVARRHLDSSSDVDTRVHALQCLARFGNESDVSNIAKLLDEEAIVYEFTDRNELNAFANGIRVEDMPPPGLKNNPETSARKKIVRLNDVALAVCLVLNSEDVTKVFPKFEVNGSIGIDLMEVAFGSDEQDEHKLAIANWRKAHPQFAEKSN